MEFIMLFESIYSSFKNELKEEDKDILHEVYIAEEYSLEIEKYLTRKYSLAESVYDEYTDNDLEAAASDMADQLSSNGELTSSQQRKIFKKMKERMKKLKKLNKLKEKMLDAERRGHERKRKRLQKKIMSMR